MYKLMHGVPAYYKIFAVLDRRFYGLILSSILT